MQHLSALLTDLYQLTMAYGYWSHNKSEQPAIFKLYFRNTPFGSSYAIACGLVEVVTLLQQWHFTKDDIAYLATQTTRDGHKLFPAAFLRYLQQLKFNCDLYAVPEGNLIFAEEPMLVIKGPLLQCQLLETVLLNLLGFATLAATKASLICNVARPDLVIEYGMRRAQGPNASLTASRAAYIGGCNATSNVVAGKLFNIPISGTMAHSWVMSFPSELDAFRAFAETFPYQTVLLLDTYNSITGVANAITVGHELRQKGCDLYAVRLDSGDVVGLSNTVRTLLNNAGFQKTLILVSGDLDEQVIAKLKQHKVPVDAWGVGTRLVTCFDQPALNIVYKLAAIYDNQSCCWQTKTKISDSPEKTTTPDTLQIKRCYKDGFMHHDILYNNIFGKTKKLPGHKEYQTKNLLTPIFRSGKLVYESPSTTEIRTKAQKELAKFSREIKQIKI